MISCVIHLLADLHSDVMATKTESKHWTRKALEHQTLSVSCAPAPFLQRPLFPVLQRPFSSSLRFRCSSALSPAPSVSGAPALFLQRPLFLVLQRPFSNALCFQCSSALSPALFLQRPPFPVLQRPFSRRRCCMCLLVVCYKKKFFSSLVRTRYFSGLSLNNLFGPVCLSDEVCDRAT